MKPEDIAQSYFKNLERAEILIELERWPEALDVLREHLSVYTDDYGALCRMAVCHHALGEFQTAYDLTKRAIEAAPDGEWAYRIQSFIFASNGEHKRSLDAAQLCVEHAPELPEALQCLFSAQVNFGELDKAAETLDLLKKMVPDSSEIHEATGFLALKLDKFQDAESAYLEALKIDPQSVTALNNLGVAYMNMSEKGLGYHYREKALEMFNRAARAQPTFKTAQENISAASTPLKFTAPIGLFAVIWVVLKILGGAADATRPKFDAAELAPAEPLMMQILNGYTVLCLGGLVVASLFLLSPRFRQKAYYELTKSRLWLIISAVFVIPAFYYLVSFWKLGVRATPFTGALFGLSMVITLISGINCLVRLRSS